MHAANTTHFNFKINIIMEHIRIIITAIVVLHYFPINVSASNLSVANSNRQILTNTTHEQILCDNSSQFPCISGQCIPSSFLCDGTPHCNDRSDESRANCFNTTCPEYTFKCASGSCINYELKCNGIENCPDGSDEDPIICETKCPPIYSSKNIHVQCFCYNQELEDCTDPPNGTIAKFVCADLYEFANSSESRIRHCINGKWNGEQPVCKPVCGAKSVVPQTLIISGANATKGEYPWQVALYTAKSKILFCGGSLIAQNIVLTAAHCVTKSSTRELIPKQAVIVSVGNYYRTFNDSRDTDAQFSDVKEIIIPKEYRGEVQNYLGDLALIITTTFFQLNKYVLPICIDWNLNFEGLFFKPLSIGVVTGWGWTTEYDQPSETLKELVVPYVSYNNCKLSFDYYQYLTHDKLCAGYVNESTSVCKGDSGGALVFPNKIDRKYYAIGIVSLSPQAPTALGGCNSQNYGLYTKISDYIHFIKGKVALHQVLNDYCSLPEFPLNGYINIHNYLKKYRPGVPLESGTIIQVVCNKNYYLDGYEIIQCRNGRWTSKVGTCKSTLASCILPDYPQHGTWEVFGSSEGTFKPKMVVESATSLKVTCYKNYNLEGQNVIFCYNGSWDANIGVCRYAPNFCPPLSSTNEMDVTCLYKNKIIENCVDVENEAIAKLKCKMNYYELISNNTNPGIIHCRNGVWDSIPKCQPVCGKKFLNSVNNDRNEKILEEPWHAVLYFGKDKVPVCGASIVSPNVLLTAASCVTNSTGGVIDKEEYIVGAGKYYRNFSDTRDKNAQLLKLSKIIVTENFRGKLLNYFGDMSLLVLERSFSLNQFVLPICIDWTSTLEEKLPNSHIRGTVLGWQLNTPTNVISNELKKISSITYIDQESCELTMYQRTGTFFSRDKFCAADDSNVTSLCSGDRGSGLTFPNKADGRHYLVGVVSAQPLAEDGDCEKQQYTLYSKLSTCLYFIRKWLNRYSV